METEKEVLEQLEQMMYKYVRHYVEDVEKELKEIFKFCVENSPPAPKSKHVKDLCYNIGDLLVVKGTDQEVVYLGYEEIGEWMKTFNLIQKKIVYYTLANLTYPKKKQTVLPAPELIAVLEANGYKFIQDDMTYEWGWSNNSLEVPNFFNIEMLQYCGKEPGESWNWRSEWLTSK